MRKSAFLILALIALSAGCRTPTTGADYWSDVTIAPTGNFNEYLAKFTITRVVSNTPPVVVTQPKLLLIPNEKSMITVEADEIDVECSAKIVGANEARTARTEVTIKSKSGDVWSGWDEIPLGN